MAFRIAFISQTGSSGKTFLAVTVATQLCKDGYQVGLIDTDHAHYTRGWSAHTWAELRAAVQPHRDIFESKATDRKTFAATLDDYDARMDVVLIDCASRADETIEETKAKIVQIAADVDLTVLAICADTKDQTLNLNCITAITTAGIHQDRIAIVPSRVPSESRLSKTTRFLTDQANYSPAERVDAARLHIHPPLYDQTHYRDLIDKGLALTETWHAALREQAMAVVVSIIMQLKALIEQPPEQQLPTPAVNPLDQLIATLVPAPPPHRRIS